MNRTVKKAKNSLKFKAKARPGALEVRIGVRKYSVPVDVRMLNSEGFLFLSFPSVSELYRVSEKELTPMGPDEDAAEAYTKLAPSRRRGRKKAEPEELPNELQKALSALPNGYKIGYGPDGKPRLVKTRRRGKKA